MSKKVFSKELEEWLASKHPKTLKGLTDVFAERSFAVLFMLLMASPALPLPTGGLTHVFEILTVVLACELIAGRKTVWIPRRWEKINIGKALEKKILPALIKIIRWFEKFSRSRFENYVTSRAGHVVIGLLVILFTAAAFIAPPFSALDTLPSLGVVVLSLGVLLGDIVVVAIGLLLGSIGIGLMILLGNLIIDAFSHFI